ncbi:MAG: hypothetical protein LBC39_07195 [Methanobrevibacter sp.]|jgi:hypothetical protein|nr:hypothetical protein [Candidatus Methanovirga aequatorialis]
MFLNKNKLIVIFALFLMVGTVHGATFNEFNPNIWFIPSIQFSNEVVISPTNGTISDALKVSDDVLLLPGTYTGEGNTNINITGNKRVHATDPGTVIIDGEGKIKLFNVEENSSLNLTNLILTGGNDSTGDGGAIFSNGSLNINDCILENNTANTGGSVYINNSLFSFVNTMILNNTGINSSDKGLIGAGAGIYIDGCNGSIENTTFENNGDLDPNSYVYGSGLVINGTFNVIVLNKNILSNIF